MKNRFWTLYRTLLSDHYGLSAAKYYYIKKRQRTWEPILIIASLLPVIAVVVGFVWKLTEQLFLGGLALGSPIWHCSTVLSWFPWPGCRLLRCSPLSISAPI